MLKSATGSGPEGRFEAHYYYDALGRRTRKNISTLHGTTETRFLWQGYRLLQEQHQGDKRSTYIYDPAEPWSSLARVEHLETDNQGELLWFSTDLNGAPLEVTDQQGTVRWSGHYGNFGEVSRQSDGFLRLSEQPSLRHQPLRYAGQYADNETGLHYNLFRFYDPLVGRFVSQDPVGLAGGWNLYQYAPNPLSWIDPLGLNKCGSASGHLPEMRGGSVSRVEKVLAKNGFTQTKVSNSAAKNQTWRHSDGSEVRVHPYGNELMKMRNGNLTPKSGLNAHVYKENPLGDQLDDLGKMSTNPDLTHIGIKNSSDYPEVRSRPHGSGR